MLFIRRSTTTTWATLFGVSSLLILANGAERVGPCECDKLWGACTAAFGEEGKNGCGRTGKSCADLCPNSTDSHQPWKPLYRETHKKLISMEDECAADATAKWGPKKGGFDGPFAVAFAGGLRNFLVRHPRT